MSDITKEEMETTLKVLEILRDDVYNHEHQTSNICNEAHYLA
jgi:hypothetical protein